MKTVSEIDKSLAVAEEVLARLDRRRAEVLAEIESLRKERDLLGQTISESSHPYCDALVSNQSPDHQKIALFRRLFKGREDVYARRFESSRTGKQGYQPACGNEWVRGLCGKPKVKCLDCDNREFLPLTNEVIRNHLTGVDPQDPSKRDFTIGVYPLLPDDTSWFLAVDFDKTTWMDDVSAFLETCKSHDVAVALERSRSGNGAHVWIFFSEPLPAVLSRKMGSFLLTETMEQRPEIGLDSYDRFFPNQDTLPKGGFGNLLALPLQKKPREKGNSLFLDDDFIPYPDQWQFLSSVRLMNRGEVETLVDMAVRRGRVVSVRMVVTDQDDDEPWTAPPSKRRKEYPIVGPLPEKITLVIGNQIYVSKEELTPSLRNRLVRLASFQNPEFYKAQAMRLSTFGKPRIISCCEDFPNHIGIPRGCLDEVADLLYSLGIETEIVDKRFFGSLADLEFHGTLRPEQELAAKEMLEHDTGVLSATTAFGKTVIAAFLIAARKANTLVLVHRRQLLDQWVVRLSNFLGLDPKEIGQIGAGKRRAFGTVDVALMQSISRKGVVDDLVGEYGHLVVDECHHISARSFEIVARQCKANYVTGLSATVTRKDGHHPIIFMQCGPVRYRVSERKEAEKRPFRHRVIVRKTEFKLPESLGIKTDLTIHEVYSSLIHDKNRNNMILDDAIKALIANRSPILLTERKEHLEILANLITPLVANVIVLKGGMGHKQRRLLQERLASIPDDEERVILATGRYLGEGFDDARLDTLFLALPVSWRGTLTQYAGRLHREHYAKKEVLIYDYADLEIPMLARMYKRRRHGYRAIGYEIDA
jgi:superfamily II DNA or RNA helicase